MSRQDEFARQLSLPMTFLKSLCCWSVMGASSGAFAGIRIRGIFFENAVCSRTILWSLTWRNSILMKVNDELDSVPNCWVSPKASIIDLLKISVPSHKMSSTKQTKIPHNASFLYKKKRPISSLQGVTRSFANYSELKKKYLRASAKPYTHLFSIHNLDVFASGLHLLMWTHLSIGNPCKNADRTSTDLGTYFLQDFAAKTTLTPSQLHVVESMRKSWCSWKPLTQSSLGRRYPLDDFWNNYPSHWHAMLSFILYLGVDIFFLTGI